MRFDNLSCSSRRPACSEIFLFTTGLLTPATTATHGDGEGVVNVTLQHECQWYKQEVGIAPTQSKKATREGERRMLVSVRHCTKPIATVTTGRSRSRRYLLRATEEWCEDRKESGHQPPSNVNLVAVSLQLISMHEHHAPGSEQARNPVDRIVGQVATLSQLLSDLRTSKKAVETARTELWDFIYVTLGSVSCRSSRWFDAIVSRITFRCKVQ